MTEAKRPVLIVFGAAGEHTFVGKLPEGVTRESVDAEVYEKGRVRELLDVKPVGKQQQAIPVDPNDDPANPKGQVQVVGIPTFGTFHWNALEPVRRMKNVAITWHYWVDDQSEDSQDEFHHAWDSFEKQLKDAREFQQLMKSNLTISSPSDLKRFEENAKRMGIKPGPDLMKAMRGARK